MERYSLQRDHRALTRNRPGVAQVFDKLRALGGVLAEREDFLELIYEDEELCVWRVGSQQQARRETATYNLLSV